MIVITGAAGFIGSNMVAKLNDKGFYDLVIADDFSRPEKQKNILGKKYSYSVDRENLIEWIEQNQRFIQIIIHIGARTDTAEFDKSIFDKLNLNYSKDVWRVCVKHGIPLIYASSAATYGMGELGFDDNHDVIKKLKPLNPYGESKNDFDKWALEQKNKPYFWAGMKFFNVYGPNEYHKGRMASVVYHTFLQIQKTGGMKLFRSHNPDYKDGEQKRDFIYVEDVTDIICFLMHNRKHSGIYNIGTGKARTFLDLAGSTFKAMSCPENIDFIDTPADIRDKYQYFTEANMSKLRSIGYDKPFTSIEEGIYEYFGKYLKSKNYR